jgi:hypothetical protein
MPRLLMRTHAPIAGSQVGGKADVAGAVQVAQLALKHRRNKNGGQRVVVFVGSPIEADAKALVKVGKQLKKNGVAVDVISMGEIEENKDKLQVRDPTYHPVHGPLLPACPYPVHGPFPLIPVLTRTFLGPPGVRGRDEQQQQQPPGVDRAGAAAERRDHHLAHHPRRRRGRRRGRGRGVRGGRRGR